MNWSELSMLETVKKLIPTKIKENLKLKKNTVNLAISYFFDFKRFNNAGYSMSNTNSYENL